MVSRRGQISLAVFCSMRVLPRRLATALNSGIVSTRGLGVVFDFTVARDLLLIHIYNHFPFSSSFVNRCKRVKLNFFYTATVFAQCQYKAVWLSLCGNVECLNPHFSTKCPYEVRGRNWSLAGKLQKKSASKQLFFSNPIDFDFNGYSLISSGFRIYSKVKKSGKNLKRIWKEF